VQKFVSITLSIFLRPVFLLYSSVMFFLQIWGRSLVKTRRTSIIVYMRSQSKSRATSNHLSWWEIADIHAAFAVSEKHTKNDLVTLLYHLFAKSFASKYRFFIPFCSILESTRNNISTYWGCPADILIHRKIRSPIGILRRVYERLSKTLF